MWFSFSLDLPILNFLITLVLLSRWFGYTVSLAILGLWKVIAFLSLSDGYRSDSVISDSRGLIVEGRTSKNLSLNQVTQGM